MKVLEYHTQSVGNECNKSKHIFKDYFFLHIHKTAGSALKNFFGICSGNTASHFKLTSNIVNNYKIITTVRNPYDRAVSTYKYKSGILRNRFKHKTFKEYVMSDNTKHPFFSSQVDYLKVDGVIVKPYYIFRYETLNADLQKFIKQEKLNFNIDELQPVRVSKHKTEVPFTEFYDDETRDIVYKAYKEDFEYFNYDYEY